MALKRFLLRWALEASRILRYLIVLVVVWASIGWFVVVPFLRSEFAKMGLVSADLTDQAILGVVSGPVPRAVAIVVALAVVGVAGWDEFKHGDDLMRMKGSSLEWVRSTLRLQGGRLVRDDVVVRRASID
jgi:hypothetical protein